MRLPFITLCVSILIYGCNKEKDNIPTTVANILRVNLMAQNLFR
jgi:hypothetical protein